MCNLTFSPGGRENEVPQIRGVFRNYDLVDNVQEENDLRKDDSTTRTLKPLKLFDHCTRLYETSGPWLFACDQ